MGGIDGFLIVQLHELNRDHELAVSHMRRGYQSFVTSHQTALHGIAQVAISEYKSRRLHKDPGMPS